MINNVMMKVEGLLYATGDTGLDLTTEATMPPADIESVEDTVTFVGNMADFVKNYAVDVFFPVLIKLIIAILIFVVGKFLVKKAVKILEKSLNKSGVEEGSIHFLSSVTYGAGMVGLVFLCAYYLKFGQGAIVAILGSAGLALGLSLQGSLSNFAGGILLLFNKPFRVGDYIIAAGNEGVVTRMDIAYTTLLTVDNRKVVLPNGTLSSSNIVNVTAEEKRRVDISIGVDYDSDIIKVKNVLEKIAQEQELVLKDEPVTIFVDNFDSSAITMGLRVWCASENYWTVKWAIQEQIKLVFDQENISIPFERVDINMLTKN